MTTGGKALARLRPTRPSAELRLVRCPPGSPAMGLGMAPGSIITCCFEAGYVHRFDHF